MSNTDFVKKGIELGIFEGVEGEKLSLRDDFKKDSLEDFLNYLYLKDLKSLNILSHIFPDKSGRYFICGEGGKKDESGLPEYVSICPAYGVSWSEIYEKRKR